jgi:hypothetical protein
MPKSNESAIAKYRKRQKRSGLVRVEVAVAREDVALVRHVAEALRPQNRERSAAFRALLKSKLEKPRNLKALLAAAPLDGVDLARSRDLGRALDL